LTSRKRDNVFARSSIRLVLYHTSLSLPRKEGDLSDSDILSLLDEIREQTVRTGSKEVLTLLLFSDKARRLKHVSK
jgi:hypothetical protein